MSKVVFKNSFFYLIASVLPQAVGFIMLPVYSRFLAPNDYGVIALVLSLQSFLPLIMTLQIHNSISRFYFDYKKDKNKLKIFISTNIILALILGSLVLLFLINYVDEIIACIFPKTIGYNTLFLLSFLTSFLSVFVSMFINLIRVQQKAKLLMKASLSIFVVSLAINILEVIVYKRGAYGIIEASLITSIISFLVYVFMVKEFFISKIDFKLLKDPIRYSIPLIPHSLSGLIFMYSDRIILERYVTLSAIGLYMFSAKIAMIFKILVNEFNYAFSPYFNEKSKLSKEIAIKETQNISLIFIYFIAMLLVIVALFSVEIVFFLLDQRYFDTWIMIPLLSSIYIFRSLYCFSSSGLFYEKKTGKVAIITIVAGLSNIGLNLLLIPAYGVMVAIYTTIFSFFLTFLISEAISYKIYYLQLNVKKNLLIVGYMFSAILFSLYLNQGFFEFGSIEYFYKLLTLMVGMGIGYKLKLFDFKNIMRIKS